MRFILLFILLIVSSGVTFAGIRETSSGKSDMKIVSKDFRFYGVFSKDIKFDAIQKYCTMPPKTAKKYLNDIQSRAEIMPTDAYYYGLLIGFAPCLKKDIIDATYYLEKASNGGINEASFLMGIISLDNNNIHLAQKYFILSAKNKHSESYYNLALLESNQFRFINKKTIGLIKQALLNGNFKAQHDHAVIMLKLFLNGKINLKQTEIKHFSNVFKNIITHTNDMSLKSQAENNLMHLASIQTQFSVRDISVRGTVPSEISKPIKHSKKSGYFTDVAEMDTKKTNNHIIFNQFQQYGFNKFENHIRFENQLFSSQN